MEMRAFRWSLGGLILLGMVACDTETVGPSELDVLGAASKLESGADVGVALFEDRLPHARFYADEGSSASSASARPIPSRTRTGTTGG